MRLERGQGGALRIPQAEERSDVQRCHGHLALRGSLRSPLQVVSAANLAAFSSPSSATFNVNNNDFDLSFFPDTDNCYQSTMTLDLKEGLYHPDRPSFFEDPKIALHKTTALARITPRTTPSRRFIMQDSIDKPSSEDIER